jgi:hypothetical protein
VNVNERADCKDGSVSLIIYRYLVVPATLLLVKSSQSMLPWDNDRARIMLLSDC